MSKSGCTLFFLLIAVLSFSQGKYAGSQKKLIGSSYADENHISGLSGWKFYEGNMITPVNDPEMIVVLVFQRGSSRAIIAGYKEDTAFAQFTIADVIELRNVSAGWQIKAASCRQNSVENIEIIALVKSAVSMEWLKPAKKAWRFNRDKRRFEILSIKGIDCGNESLE